MGINRFDPKASKKKRAILIAVFVVLAIVAVVVLFIYWQGKHKDTCSWVWADNMGVTNDPNAVYKYVDGHSYLQICE